MRSKSTEPLTAERLYLYALRLLTARDYTSAKLLLKLVAWGEERELAEAVLVRLQDAGLVDDQRYAERFAESAMSSGRYVGARLRMELRRRGIAVAIVDEVVRRLGSEFDEEAELQTVVNKRYPGFSYAAADDRQRRRVASFLQRRGFSLGLILKVLRRQEDY